MKACVYVLVAGAIASSATIANAGPWQLYAEKPSKGPAIAATDNPFSDNFDSYVAGTGIAGQGGWQLWDGLSLDAWVDGSVAASTPNSMRIDGQTDVVRLVDHTTGKWRLSLNSYFSSTNFTAHGTLIALNTFPYTGLSSWSMQVMWDYTTGHVYEDATPATSTLIVYDQWVPVVVEVDLDADTFSVWYNSVQIVDDRPWSTNYAVGGSVRIQCWDFYGYGPGTNVIWYDDIVFEEIAGGCYANCDNSTTEPILNVDDFTCFINNFANAQSLPHAEQVTHYANCDNSTTAPVLNVDDFTCFINAFAQGCS